MGRGEISETPTDREQTGMNYDQEGNRYTAIYLREAADRFKRLPFDVVRFNVDIEPNAPRSIVPSGNDHGKVFEKVWIVNEMPWSQKVSFEGPPDRLKL
jgi:hypothetical protein